MLARAAGRCTPLTWRGLPIMRKLTRLQSIIAGGAFTLAGIGGVTATALGHDSSTPANTSAAQDTVAAVQADTTPASVTDQAAAAPSDQDLHPVAVSGDQKTFTP